MAPLAILLRFALSLAARRGDPPDVSSAPSVRSRRSPPFPPPPWTFVAGRIRYQFFLAPASAARRAVGPAAAAEGGGGLNLLTLGDRTLGGLFAVEYESSPVGPYREVAVLSGLVARGLTVGAWASHIFVDSEDAADAGRRIWGLPAKAVPVDFDGRPSGSPGFFVSDGGVSVSGWAAAAPTDGGVATPSSLLGALDVTLPSFSGRLEAADPILRYPLTVSRPRGVSMGPAGTVACGRDIDDALRSVLDDSEQLFAVDVGRVRLSAGAPSAVVTR